AGRFHLPDGYARHQVPESWCQPKADWPLRRVLQPAQYRELWRAVQRKRPQRAIPEARGLPRRRLRDVSALGSGRRPLRVLTNLTLGTAALRGLLFLRFVYASQSHSTTFQVGLDTLRGRNAMPFSPEVTRSIAG